MSGVVIALMFSVGAGTWLYTKFMRRSGGNAKNSLLAAGLIAVIAFFMIWSIISMIDNAL